MKVNYQIVHTPTFCCKDLEKLAEKKGPIIFKKTTNPFTRKQFIERVSIYFYGDTGGYEGEAIEGQLNYCPFCGAKIEIAKNPTGEQQ